MVPFHVHPCGKLVAEPRLLDLMRLLHAHRDGRWFYTRLAMEHKAKAGTFRAGWDRITIDEHGKRRIVKMYGFFASGRQYLQNLGTYGTVPQSPAQDPVRNSLFDRNDGVANWGFELITCNLSCKLHFDFECKFLGAAHPDPTHRLLQPFLHKLRADLKSNCGVESAEIDVWQGSRQTTANEFKLSYHIIVVRDPNPRHSAQRQSVWAQHLKKLETQSLSAR